MENSLAFISATVAGIAAIGAGIAAFASWRTAKETKNLVLAKIINDIRDQFDSPEIFECKAVLLESRIEQGEGKIAKILTMQQMIYQGKDQRNKAFSEFVRIYYNLFHKIKILLDTNCINSEILKKVILLDELDLLFNIVEPLVKDHPEYDHLIFETYRKIFE
jgi:hypothetical protein